MTQSTTSSKLYVSSELGCILRINEGEVEYTPLMSNNTFDLDDFSVADEAEVGTERVLFRGVDTDLSGVYEYLRKVLA